MLRRCWRFAHFRASLCQICSLGNRFQQLPPYRAIPLFYQQRLKGRSQPTHSDQRNRVFDQICGLKRGLFVKNPVSNPRDSRAVSFSCRGGAPVPAQRSEMLIRWLVRGVGTGAVSFFVGAVPRVPAQRSETHTKSWTKRVGTGALPLQNDDWSPE